MAIENIRVESTISPAVHARLRGFMSENGLTESEAIATILTTYLGSSASSSPDEALPVGETSRQSSEVPTPSAIPTGISVSLPQLAEHLKCSPDELAKIQNYPVVLSDYTKDRDPQGKAWEYDGDSQRFFPME